MLFPLSRGPLTVARRRLARLSVVGVLAAGCVTAQVPARAQTAEGQLAYVASWSISGRSQLVVIDTATGSMVDRIDLPQPPGSVAVDPAGTQVLITTGHGDIQVLDTATDTLVGTFRAGTSPNHTAFSPTGDRIYVTDTAGDGTVFVLDAATHAILASIAAGGGDLAVSPDGTRVYSTSTSTGALSVIDTASDTVVANVAYGSGTGAVAVNGSGTRVYVTDTIADTLTAINTATDTIEAVTAVQHGPSDVAVNPAGTRVYVTGRALSVIDTGTSKVIANISVFNLGGIAVNADGSAVYVTSRAVQDAIGALLSLDPTTNTITPGSPTSGYPIDFALGPVGGRAATTLTVSPPATVVAGTAVTLTATLTPAIPGTVQFYDTPGGSNRPQPLGSPVPVVDGTAVLTTSSLSQNEQQLTAAFIPAQPGLLRSASRAVDLRVVAPGVFAEQRISQTGTGAVSTAPITTAGPRLLVAFTSADGPAAKQRTTVSGGGLTWRLVRRADRVRGTAEIWSAYAPGPLNNAQVTSCLRHAGFDQLLTVVVFFGATGTGATGATGAFGGTPLVSLTTTAPGSVVYGVGEDYTNAVTPNAGPNQAIDSFWQDLGPGETFWTQHQFGAIPDAGTTVTLSDLAPNGDEWNMAAAEILVDR